MSITSIIIIAAVILIVAVLLFLIVWQVRSRRFRPSADKRKQQTELNADLEEAGFAYETNGDYFYSLMNCWQRDVGYCRLYDEGAPLFNMIMDCEPVTFSYAGKRWLIELWKGQYGITTGGEIGVYSTDREDIEDDKFRGTFYENISDDERLKMEFVLRKNGSVILRRKALHWWLTGFILGEFSHPDSLTMDAKITFPDREMRDAFAKGLTELGYRRKDYSMGPKSVSVHYTKPHTPQLRDKAREVVVQQTNKNNCKLYKFSTGKYSDTLDKLEYVKAMMPELYGFFTESLYAKGVYDAFGWIKEWLEGRHPGPGPKPPKPPKPPCPPCDPCDPCRPEPPCKPCDPCRPEPPCKPCEPCRPEPPCKPCEPCHTEPPCKPCEPCYTEPPCAPYNQYQPEPPCDPCNSCQPEPPCGPCNQYQPEPPCDPCNPCQPEPPCSPCKPEQTLCDPCTSGSASSSEPSCPSESSSSEWPYQSEASYSTASPYQSKPSMDTPTENTSYRQREEEEYSYYDKFYK